MREKEISRSKEIEGADRANVEKDRVHIGLVGKWEVEKEQDYHELLFSFGLLIKTMRLINITHNMQW